MSNTVLYCRTANGGMDVIEQQLETLLRFNQKTGYAPSAAYCDCNDTSKAVKTRQGDCRCLK